LIQQHLLRNNRNNTANSRCGAQKFHPRSRSRRFEPKFMM
jgi:hypothetical protein